MSDHDPKVIGELIRARLEDGLSVEVDYQPGDMTRYELVFTPFSTMERLHGHRGVQGLGTVRHQYVLVSLPNFGGSYPFRLLIDERDPPHPDYIRQKLMPKHKGSSVYALHELFAGIIGCEPWVTQAQFEAGEVKA